MNLLLKQVNIHADGGYRLCDAFSLNGCIVSVDSPEARGIAVDQTVNCGGAFLLPGFADVHVHFREPGFSYKETIASGSRAAARGGYTTVCTMANLSPVPDSAKALSEQLERIRRDAVVRVIPYGSITVGEKGETLAAYEEMAPAVVGFSDDGVGVQDERLMLEAMRRAAALGKPIVAHCEDKSLLLGGYIHKGEYAAAHGHRGICSESEWGPIARDLALVEEAGCAYHVCHVSTKESVAILREAKRRGINVTCETAPHYLVMDDSDLREEGRFKMNPPLRSASDREALLEGILDGTIDMIATDHAPHSAEEKGKGLEKSAFGVVGLETAFPILYTYLVKPGILSLERLLELMAYCPRRRFSLPGEEGDFSLWDLNWQGVVDPSEFLSKGRATPFEGWSIFGRCIATVCDGRLVWSANA